MIVAFASDPTSSAPEEARRLQRIAAMLEAMDRHFLQSDSDIKEPRGILADMPLDPRPIPEETWVKQQGE